ncbi:MAG: response regulator, partial [Deltaproteobacteria bacterium]|nr:response regulator [Deltaproteobacteria bacterium]
MDKSKISNPKSNPLETMDQVEVLNVAIVGGGPECKAIMDMIFAEKLSQLRMKLIGVADFNPGAVGYCYAQEKGIYTTKDYRDLYRLKGLNMIIEVTGRDEVANEIHQTRPRHVRVMDNVTARVFWDIFQIEEERLAERKRAEEGVRDTVNRLQIAYEQSITYARELNQEIGERERAEEAVRESEERYRRITEAVTDYVFTVRIEDGHPGETVHGPACVAVTGYTPEEFASDPYLWIRMVHEEDHALVQEQARRILLGQDAQPIEHRILRKDGVMRWVRNTLVPHHDTQGNLLSYDGLIEDIHERKEAEEAKVKLEVQLRQAQKMEAIGTLAGGIAHDFNNILFAIFGFVELTTSDLPEGSQGRKNLGQVLKAANRAKDLIRQVLTFSRQVEQERKPLQLQLIVKEGLKLLRATLPTTIEIRHNIDKERGYIMADPTQVHQVIMNLCTNANHAMRQNGGLLEVSLQNVNFGPPWCDRRCRQVSATKPGLGQGLRNADWKRDKNRSKIQIPNSEIGLAPGPYVRLSVSDTGHGMDQATMERIFDPFFTTKPVGDGTGMGLATVHGIITSHGGAITVHSELEKGTTFDVYFPRFESGVALEAEMAEPLPRGNERILFVDDEEPLVRMGQQMLERLGYHVTARTSSVEALEAFRAQPDRFDLVITDQTMPNMTGVELAKELMRIRPDIPIILITGFSEIVPPEKAKKMGI